MKTYEMEQSVLGSVLIDSERLCDVSHLKAEDFSDLVHRSIFKAILELDEKGIKINHQTVGHHLKSTEIGKEIVEKNYLLYLTGIAIAVLDVSEESRIVQDCSKKRQIVQAINQGLEMAQSYSLEYTAEDVIDLIEGELYKICPTSQNGFKHIHEVAKELLDIKSKELRSESGKLFSGLKNVDAIINGFEKGNLVILAARPSMGKSTLMLNFAYDMALKGKTALVISLEMKDTQLVEKICSMNVSTEADFNQLMNFVNNSITTPFFIDDTSSSTLSKIRTTARRLKRTHRLDVLFIDYLQLIEPSGKSFNRVAEITQITSGLKALARELDIPIIALSQLSREVEKRLDKRPQLSDLRDSGSIEQDADIVMFLYRKGLLR